VGQVVGQLATIMGCRAVGIAGTPEKVGFVVDELGFEAGINYRSDDLDEALAKACPDGVDVYFDNVGGAVSEAVFRHLADRARIAVCGQISQYNLERPDLAPRDLAFLTRKRVRMEGFLVFDFDHRADEARGRLARWLREGKLAYQEDVVEGLENAPEAFIGLLRG
jgi:NADPH:quinone reductase